MCNTIQEHLQGFLFQWELEEVEVPRRLVEG